MSWTEIKHSVNSDLHKPLNKLIEEKIATVNGNPDVPLDELIQTLLSSSGGEKAYTPSDNLLEVVLDEEMVLASPGESFQGRTIYVGRWVPKHSGTVKISASISSIANPSIGYTTDLQLYSGGLGLKGSSMYNFFEVSEIGAIRTSAFSSGYAAIVGTNSDSYALCETTFVVQKGDPVYFVLTVSPKNSSVINQAAVNSIKIYADEVS